MGDLRRRPGLAVAHVLTGAALLCGWGVARADYDRTRYMGPEELRPGMRGFGRTVMSGAKIETFQVEVIAVMRNAYYARQDVILVRCSGLNLEHSGIIGGMSGSPCYIHDDQGRDRLIGAVAYGWTFNKDPICGVQPITQMLPIPEVRAPREPSAIEKKAAAASPRQKQSNRGGGVNLGELLARVADEPFDDGCRLSIFNDEIRRVAASRPSASAAREGLRPLLTPVMISGMTDRGMERLARPFEKLGLIPLASGGPSAAAVADADSVKLEPGSVLCVPFVSGDIMMEGLGTCTWVEGSRVLGFGHSMFGEGSVELPLATGIVHTVISSVARSNKMGAALRNVGTLLGDENSGIFGLVGKSVPMVPLEVVVRDIRGEQTFRYNLVQERLFTPLLLGTAIMESAYSHSDLPREHHVRYSMEIEFKDLGTYRVSNFSSQSGVSPMATESATPVGSLMDSPFGRAKLVRARGEVTIEPGARLAELEDASLVKNVFKPGERVAVQVRWRHYMAQPQYTRATYELQLPADLPDGEYNLAVGSSKTHLIALRQEKPHLFDVDSLAEMLKAFNMISSFPDSRLYLHLTLPSSGLAVKDTEMPRLPSYRREMLLASHSSDIHRFTESLLVTHETPFSVSGQASLKVKVSRRADQ